jgi:D-amino peptidase
MKVFISVDMEGATGIVHNDQLLPGGHDYARGRELLTGDVAAAVGAALSMDEVSHVLVCDGHGNMRNLLIDKLPMNCEVVVGPASSKSLCQSEGLDASFGAVLFVGYHARAGSKDAVLPHTWIGSLIHEVRVNGRVFGETAINAAVAGEFGAPVAFVSGDAALVAEAKADLGADLVAVAVKRAVGPKAAVCRTPAATAQDIRLGVLQGLESGAGRPPGKGAGGVEFVVAFHQVAQADRAAKRPGVERTAPREITLRRATYLDAVRDAWQTCEWTAAENPEWLK